ncbi:MAG: hypothetical protein M0C28_40615 [Candidatus Moduliflexus flocculans]|nr:hypothetical protein [Candidatus Moduliflexus flocculans]
MLFSTAAGLAALDKKRNPRRFVLWTVGLMFLGGFVLGPLMQKFAFGVAWTGFPLGTDLTDNKTLIAFLAWIVALAAGRKGRPARPFVLARLARDAGRLSSSRTACSDPNSTTPRWK